MCQMGYNMARKYEETIKINYFGCHGYAVVYLLL